MKRSRFTEEQIIGILRAQSPQFKYVFELYPNSAPKSLATQKLFT